MTHLHQRVSDFIRDVWRARIEAGGKERERSCSWLEGRDVGAYGRMKTREDKIPG